jgi:hypothetical protein
MKWILVVLIGGMSPVQTDLQFDRLTDCLSAEEQLRRTYADAYEAWDKWAVTNIERRRDYVKARELRARMLANTGTCVPHSGRDEPASTGNRPAASATPPPAPSSEAHEHLTR